MSTTSQTRRRVRAGGRSPRLQAGDSQAQREARGGAEEDQAGVGDHGKSTRALGAALRERGRRHEAAEVIGAAFDELAPVLGVKPACVLLGHSRAGHYRRQQPPMYGPPRPRPAPPNALTAEERAHVLAVLHQPEHIDLAVTQVWARLLDASIYLCSISMMYRILRDAGEHRERRRQRTHPAKTKPQLQATGPNQVWSWDITRLPGPTRGTFYDLYVIIDIYSRYVVAWMVAPSENAELAKAFIADAIAAQGIDRDQLTIHADRGSSMTSKPVAQLLVDLDVTRTHSRPHVSNDNPFSEANFKTLKYCPAFPGQFGSIQHARSFCAEFFGYYNHEHRSPGVLGLWRDGAPGRLANLSATVLQGCGARGLRAQTACFRPSRGSNAPSADRCRPRATPVVHVAGRRCPSGPPSAQILAFRPAGPLEKHRHSGIGLHTAASVHYGTATEVRELRQQTLDAAYAANPDRFSNRRPHPPKLPAVAWINQPTPEALIQSA